MAGYREYRLRVYESRTLKDKRAVRRSMLARIRNKFHAACAEIDTQDNVGILTIGIAVVSNSTTQIGKMLDEQAVSVRVVPTPGQWFGMTYSEDTASVCSALAGMTAQGIYPSPLF